MRPPIMYEEKGVRLPSVHPGVSPEPSALGSKISYKSGGLWAWVDKDSRNFGRTVWELRRVAISKHGKTLVLRFPRLSYT
jgi:hypothetical protein